MNEPIAFKGKFLYLSCDPSIIRQQINGSQVALDRAIPLRDDISTDEITPVTCMLTYDETLGQFPYIGLLCNNEKPIGNCAVRDGGFDVVVAGKRYGKGSSRESSPLAELYAGVRLIIAESFERIYQQNCANIGIFTSTDFGLINRIRAGEPIPVEEFLNGRDILTQGIIRAGGLLRFSRTMTWPRPSPSTNDLPMGPLTLVEKIIARHSHPHTQCIKPGSGVFLACDWRFSHDYFTGMAAHFMHRAFGNPATLHDPSSIVAFQDHLVLAPKSIPHVRNNLLPGIANLTNGHRTFTRNYPVRVHEELPDGSGSEGICHAVMAERYALPGQVIAGTDSHTPHSGALGCLAFGAGSTDLANSWVTGYVRCKVPETIRVHIDGELAEGVTAKDIVLYLLRMDPIKTGEAIGAVFEYTGSTIQAMSVDERATLTNMVAELGGFTGIVAPDQNTVAFLKERRGIDFQIEDWMFSDPDAATKATIHIDAAKLSPMVARPGDPGNGVQIGELTEDQIVDIAYGGSCTGGKRADFDYYHEVLQWALDQGKQLAAGTRLYLQFGTVDVQRYCESMGYTDTFRKIGAEIIMPGCGACANCGPGQSTEADEVTISAINRNFPGRSGPGSVWLASPYTVAASAIAGKIVTFEALRNAHD
jgi:3-isopropylmalate/(R)-2-methylmalate dehydratase large subunit